VNEEMVLDGWWVEFSSWPGVGRAVTSCGGFAGEAWQTVIRLEPGVPRLLFPDYPGSAPSPERVIPPSSLVIARDFLFRGARPQFMRAGEIYVVRLQ
jgi:hypothetical protein